MEPIEPEILKTIQSDFPLVCDPYGHLGVSDPDQAFRAVRSAVAEGLIRRLGPRFSSRGLGYAGTLAAVRVCDADIAGAAERINHFDEVTHNYQRDGAFAIWFTLIAATRSRIDEILGEIRSALALEADGLMDLPAERIFKLDVRFGVHTAPSDPSMAAPPAPLTDAQRRVVIALQGGLPVVRHPYAQVAGQLGISTDSLLAILHQLRAEGRIRSMGAILNQRKIGYHVNVMIVWDVRDEQAEAAGRRFAEVDAVSHCYLRPRRPGWGYNLYTMLHAKDESAAEAMIEQMAAAEGVRGYQALPTIREFKKTAPVYG